MIDQIEKRDIEQSGHNLSFVTLTFGLKRNEPKTHNIPKAAKVCGAPNLPAMAPASRQPKGTTPINATIKRLITLPRLSSWTIVCRTVLLDAI